MQTKQSEELEERLMNFGVGIIRFVSSTKEIPTSVADQVIRSSTSIGANYAEAQNASSRADFKNKIYIAKKEAAESRYWLRIIEKLSSTQIVAKFLHEVQEILLILQKIVNTLRAGTAT